MNKLTGYVFFSSCKLPRVRENLIAVHNTYLFDTMHELSPWIQKNIWI